MFSLVTTSFYFNRITLWCLTNTPLTILGFITRFRLEWRVRCAICISTCDVRGRMEWAKKLVSCQKKMGNFILGGHTYVISSICAPMHTRGSLLFTDNYLNHDYFVRYLPTYPMSQARFCMSDVKSLSSWPRNQTTVIYSWVHRKCSPRAFICVIGFIPNKRRRRREEETGQHRVLVKVKFEPSIFKPALTGCSFTQTTGMEIQ